MHTCTKIAAVCTLLKMLALCLLLILFVISGIKTTELESTRAQPVNVSVYYECVCPDSRRFIRNQLWPTYQQLYDIMDIELIPYGKARERKQDNGTYSFSCQFGPNECYGNLIQTCAVKLLNITKSLAFINCMEAYLAPYSKGLLCARREDLDYNIIEECTESRQGNEWQHEMAQKTEILSPRLTYVPWIILNGRYSSAYLWRALSDLKGLICQLYEGPKPEKCP